MTQWKHWVGLGARLVLGVVLFIAGVLKVGDLEGSVFAVNAYQILPYDMAVVVGYALPFIEMVAGLLLILGLFTRLSASAGTLLMVVFIIGIASAWARGLELDCGCFGGGGPLEEGEEPTYLIDIIRDIGLAACGIWLMLFPKTKFALEDVLFKEVTTED